MGTTWKCRIGWHAYVRQPGEDDPNLQICLRCHKKRGPGTALMGIGPGGGGAT